MNHSHKGDFEMCSDALEEYKRDSMSFVEIENTKMPPQGSILPVPFIVSLFQLYNSELEKKSTKSLLSFTIWMMNL
jgi:hypothetical protein